MKRKTKRILGMVLAMCMLIGCLPFIAVAESSGVCGENLTWRLDNGTLTISGTGDMRDWSYAPWYSTVSSITDVVIEDGVTSIGEHAFSNCKKLVKVSIPPSVNRIGTDAFANISSQTEIYISDLAAWCGIDFENRSSNPLGQSGKLYVNGELLTNAEIPEGVTSIEKYAFFECVSITDVTIPQGVEEIGESAFSWCENLTDASIPQSIAEIGEGAFVFCYNLEAIDVDENNESYMSEDGVLFDKEQTSIIHYPSKRQGSSYTIPDGVERIEYGAFSGSVNLGTINIPDSVKYIGEFAFDTCHNLTSLTIPDGVTTICQGMAADCEKLSSIKFPDTITILDSNVINGTAYYKDESNWIDGVLYVDNCLIEAKRTLSGNYRIKNGTVMIGDDAFYLCNKVTGVSIPESVKGIGFSAFDGTAFYKDASNWTDNALYIDKCLIDIKEELSGDYKIADSTRLIADYAFSGANGITSITIPESVTSIGDRAFYIYNENIDLKFMAKTAAKHRGEEFWENIGKIYIHEDYEGYTAENGYDESKIIVEPHSYESGICSVCGAEKPKIERTDSDSDTEYKFSINMGQAYENCNVYAATYDMSGKLLDVNSVPLAMTGSVTALVRKSEYDKTVKVFVWREGQQPVIKAEKFDL